MRIRVTGNLIVNANIFGIDVEPNTNCQGRDITIANNVIDGVQATYYKNSMVHGRSNALGISVSCGSLPDQVSNIVIAGNTIRNVKRWRIDGITDFGGICIAGAKNVSVTGNAISAGESAGIVVRSDSKGISVSANTITAMYGSGIVVAASTDTSISGNTIDDVTASGIVVWTVSSNVTVTANVVNDSTGPGIYIQNASKVAVAANIIRDTRAGGARLMNYGVHVANLCADVAVTSNVISNTTSDPTRDKDSSTNVIMAFNTEDAVWRTRTTNFHLFSDGNLYKSGWIKITATAAAATPVGALFVDSADGKLKFKDSAGVVNILY